MFSDVQNHWAKSSILELAGRNLVSGYPDGTFRPNAPVTRAEFAVLMFNCFSEAPIIREPLNFKDVTKTYWAYDAIQKATSRVFLVGYPDKTFKPEQQIPRVQTIIAYAGYKKLEIPTGPEIYVNTSLDQLLKLYFEDAADIPIYAKPLMLNAAYHYYVVNYPNSKKLNPNKPSTRGEVAALICQALKFWGAVTVESIATENPLAIFPQYDFAAPFSQGLAVVSNRLEYPSFGYQQIVIDQKGKPVIDLQAYNWTSLQFSDGLLQVSVNEKAGFITKSGNMVISPQFEAASDFSEVFAAVYIDGKYGYIDPSGTMRIPPQFDQAGQFKNGMAMVSLNQKYGYINQLGKVIIPIEYESASDFSEGLAKVKIEGKFGFINPQGNLVISPQFESCESFSEGLARVKLENQYGFIDKTGKIVIKTSNHVESFSEGLAAILVNDKWGFIDKTGKIVIAPQFYGINHIQPSIVKRFSEGLAAVRLGAICGFIDQNGNWVIRPKFSDADSFSEGVASVNWGGKWISRPTAYDGSAVPTDWETVLEDGKWGYIKNPLK
ncbi:WG repeat-containing protein [Limnoraphis robusta Tam1]|uniref:WG repeat-containing protein n=1 Tax=Limnoraphis robusta TaxID=1118279 RepID=UPI002B1F3A00|nr:WG repeat-containing protein [Limnoraphis robusta]MEA5500893.1 WG repeat-containing protein [Limnoraphis robusta BA-68 BA1]MEA5537963.1 WG repeat-containing protein [Limnoraphis robusta Tam1]